MAERYRDARGRWVSASALPNLASYFRETYRAGREVQRERIERPEPAPPPPPPPPATNWDDTYWKGGGTVRSADGSPLSPDAFENIPDDAVSFQVRFIMPDNPDYPRGWASYSSQTYDEWDRMIPQDDGTAIRGIDQILKEGEQKGASGVGAIVFHS